MLNKLIGLIAFVFLFGACGNYRTEFTKRKLPKKIRDCNQLQNEFRSVAWELDSLGCLGLRAEFIDQLNTLDLTTYDISCIRKVFGKPNVNSETSLIYYLWQRCDLDPNRERKSIMRLYIKLDKSKITQSYIMPH